DLRLPLPAEVTLRLYATPKLFEQGLVQDGGVAPSLAATISGLAVGASLESSLFLLEPSIGLGRSADPRRGARERLRRVAHARTPAYFQAFARERDRALNFRAVFGETPEDLARRLWPAACHC